MNMINGHQYHALEIMPESEISLRHARIRENLRRNLPRASGLLVFSRINIYYLTGTLPNGIFWLPLEGEGVLLVRKGIERARLESPVANIGAYRSYKELASLFASCGSPLGEVVAAEMSGLTWNMADMLRERLPDVDFVAGDNVLNQTRMIKSPFELALLREAGTRHRVSLTEIMPRRVRPGMTENEIARILIQTLLEQGHNGLQRMADPKEENFFGHVSANDSGNYPGYYNGPMGFRGLHPAQPCLGSGVVWEKGTPLAIDTGFVVKGYCTDKTQSYWAGSAARPPQKYGEAYAICVEIHNRAAEALRPGAIPAQIWQDTLDFVAQTPFNEGFMGLGANREQFLGHGIGLMIDEKPVIAKGFAEPLQAGMVLAVEPKIGLPGLGMVGIENTFEITDAGSKCLTATSTDMIFIE